MSRDAIFAAIDAERARQDEKHGDFSAASPFLADGERLAILVEEVGEVARGMQDGDPHAVNLRAELVQVAAVAVAWLESLGGAE